MAHAALGSIAGGTAGAIGMGVPGGSDYGGWKGFVAGATAGAGIGYAGARWGMGRGIGKRMAQGVSKAGDWTFNRGFNLMGRNVRGAGTAGGIMSRAGMGIERAGAKLAANNGRYAYAAMTTGAAATAGLIGNSIMSSNSSY
jgi:hypothetical protein